MGEGLGNVHARRRFTGRARYYTAAGASAVLIAGVVVGTTFTSASAQPNTVNSVPAPAATPQSKYQVVAPTATPIKHVVVIFDENESFDHYFGTYPYATNTDGNYFSAKAGTPTVTGLYSKLYTIPKVKKHQAVGVTGQLLTNNPNTYNPQRLSYDEALTCDQDHDYGPEQAAYDGGRQDLYVQNTGSDATCNAGTSNEFASPGLVMDYYDGNTVTALWNYAQNFAMSDNDYDTNFGPSSPGAINLISGDDGGGYAVNPTTGAVEADPGSVSSLNSAGLGTIYGDLDPAFDDCSDASHTAADPVGVETGQNIGEMLDSENVTWGWFQGGFAPTGKNSAGYAVCGTEHENIGGTEVQDYVPHHDPFQFYKATANPKHLPPTSEAAIGHTDQANHQYDLSLFYDTLKDGNLPAVSFLKPAAYENGHPGYSDPIDEQRFLVNTINAIEASPDWDSTAIIITYDDSDGWYDSAVPSVGLISGSDTSIDGSGCASTPDIVGGFPDRCGYGPRLPLLVISPYTQQNYVSANLTDTTSIIQFIEDNWLAGSRIGDGSFDAIAGSLYKSGGVLDFVDPPHFTPVYLNPTTGEVQSTP
jgi:phospholipase C